MTPDQLLDLLAPVADDIAAAFAMGRCPYFDVVYPGGFVRVFPDYATETFEGASP